MWIGKETGLTCDRMIPTKTKIKIFKCMVRSVMIFGWQTVLITEKCEMKLKMEELKMLKFS